MVMTALAEIQALPGLKALHKQATIVNTLETFEEQLQQLASGDRTGKIAAEPTATVTVQAGGALETDFHGFTQMEAIKQALLGTR